MRNVILLKENLPLLSHTSEQIYCAFLLIRPIPSSPLQRKHLISRNLC